MAGASPLTHRTVDSDSPHPNQLIALPDKHCDISHVVNRIPDDFIDRSIITPFFPLSIPHTLPLYSASGFDMLRILAKVAMRPNPRIMLGPVDLTCSFIVADARQPDNPIVYASPTFFRLTGYYESEVRGRNCRFLQSPSGDLQRGEPRLHTAPDAVRHLYRSILQDKECQASLVNYRKDGAAFVNLVTVIPISEDDSGETTHHVGFQVDLVQQPGAILQKLRDGSYIVNYSATAAEMGGRRDIRKPGKGLSAELLNMMKQQGRPGREIERAEIQSLILDNSDDFIHVLSLKGLFLYVAPSITRTLGYNAEELIGRSIADLCHPADVVPVMRGLKDASTIPPPGYPPHMSPPQQEPNSFPYPFPHTHPPSPPPRPTSLLFRARHKNGEYVWLLSRGKLHVEPTKGRKAVILVGRRIEGGVVHSNGLGGQVEQRVVTDLEPGTATATATESGWGLVAPNGIILSASRICTEKLGFAPTRLSNLINTPSSPPDSPAVHLSPIDSYPFLATGSNVNPPSAGMQEDYHHATSFWAAAPGQLHISCGPIQDQVPLGPVPTLVGQTLMSLVSSPPSSGHKRRLGDVLAAAACAGVEEVRKIRCRMKVIGRRKKGTLDDAQDHHSLFNDDDLLPSLPVEIRFYAREHDARGKLPKSLVFEMVFLDERDTASFDVAEEVEKPAPSPTMLRQMTTSTAKEHSFGMGIAHPTPRQALFSSHSFFEDPSTTATQDYPPFSSSHIPFSSSSSTSFTSPSSCSASRVPATISSLSRQQQQQQPSASSPTYSLNSSSSSSMAASSLKPKPPPFLSVLSTSTTTVETSWQYELTRLRLENERMKAELVKLEEAAALGKVTGGGASSGQGPGTPPPPPPAHYPSLKRPRE